MNTDKLTSILGLVTSLGSGGSLMANAPTFSKAWWAGLVVVLAGAAWGYLTNKTVWPK